MKRIILIIILISTISGCTEKRSDLLVGKWEQVFDDHDPLRFDDNWKFLKLTFYRDGTGSRETHLKNEESKNSKNFTYTIIHDGNAIQIQDANNIYSTSKIKSEELEIINLTDEKMTLRLMEALELTFKKVH